MLVRHIWPSRPTLANPMLRLLESLETAAGESAAEPTAGVFPPVNVTQDDNHYYVRAEVPGVRASDLTISALRNRVSISGRREIPQEHERASYHRKERADGTFDRTIALPTDLDSERVEASYTDGILTLKLPKAAAAKPRQITVNT